MTSKKAMARILQNMIEEAEENLDRLGEVLRIEQSIFGKIVNVEYLRRREELAEAMALKETLDIEITQQEADDKESLDADARAERKEWL
jgi:hypothetical protein